MKPLKPVMAAFLAASSFAFALPRTAVADEPAPNSDGVARAKALTHDKEFVAHLISLVDGKPEVRKDVGERLAKFIQSREKGKQYLTDGLLNDAAILDKVSVTEAKKWPETNKAESGKVAALYYVIGANDGKVPAWAPAGYEDEFKANPQWSGRLTDGLTSDGWSTTRQVSQTAAANGTIALLDDAAKWSLKILDDARTAGEIHQSIIANETTGLTPPETAKKSNPLDATGSGFGFDDLYVKGAKSGNVYGPKDEGFRTLSIKVYTSKDANGNPINQIGVVDITKGDINTPSTPQFIDASHAGDSEIVMRDGGRHYIVTVGVHGDVTLTRKGAKNGDGGGSISTTKSELTGLRDEQIRNSGTVTVGGQPYYVLGQGGQKGSFLFFSKAAMDAAPTGNAHPELMGDVAQVVGDGSTAPIKGKPDLGTLPNGDPYHLEFDMGTRLWKVVKGQGDVKDDKKGKDQKDSKDSKDSKETADKPTPTTGETDPNDTGTTVDEAVKLAKGVWTEEPDSFDPATHAQARIMSHVADGAKTFEVLFDPKFGVKGGAWAVSLVDPKTNAPLAVRDVRGMGKYIGLEFKTSTVYYDVDNLAKFAKGKQDDPAAPAGTYQTSNAQMANVKSVDIMEDSLVHYMKIKKGDKMIATIRERVAKYAGDDDYLLNGDVKTLHLSVGDKVDRNVWPEDVDASDKGNNAGLTGLHGPGTVVNVAAGETGPYQDMDLGQGRTATLVKTENHAAMYLSTEDQDDGKPAKVWAIMFEYKKNGLDSRSGRVPITRFVGMDALPDYHMQGLVGVEVGQNPVLGMLNGSDSKNGAIALYKNVVPDAQGGQNLKDKVGNCLGSVLAWGNVTLARAQKACMGDSKL
jgi:hypothetical protein